MDLEGCKELVDTGKSSRMCSDPLFFFVWPFGMGPRAFLAQKWLFLALNCSF